MKLRKLEEKDAVRMLEWMHNPAVVADLSANFIEKTIDDCKAFVAAAQSAETDLHLAITDDADIYMGTVSLKHIDRNAKTAEFAITVHHDAMGKGYSQYGMAEILRYGIAKLGLSAIYWCVSRDNKRAVRFYDKNGYTRAIDVPAHIADCYTPEQQSRFLWYCFQ